MIRHLILDRDGVLVREAPDGGWTLRPEDLRWERSALEGLRTLCQGRRVSVATNQSCVGRGIATRQAVDAVNARLIADAAAAGARIDAVFVCPHAPDAGCACRKPAPGLLLDAIAASGIPAGETLFVGDSPTDLEAGRRAGVAVALVRTGKGAATATTGAAEGVEVLDDLADLAVFLSQRTGPGR